MKTGIDLGTTNSAIAVSTDDGLRIVKNREQMETTPSVVRIEKNGRVLVGRKAYDSRVMHPGNVALEFKRILGQRDGVPFDGVEKQYTPEELSAEVLKALLDDAERVQGKRPRSAVITVPAAFGQLQCEATARAARLAGLDQAPLLQEPIAAAVAYGCSGNNENKKWLVYDLGGGTFDVALVSIREGRLNVLEHRGDNVCGGKDIDRELVENCLQPRLSQRFRLPSLDAPDGRRLKQVLYQAAEEAKIELSTSKTATAYVFDAGEDLDGELIDAEIPVTREDIESATGPILRRSLELCQAVLAAAGAQPDDVAGILLVGGPTQIPLIRERLESELGIALEFSLDPMTVVAQGAAIFAESALHDDDPAVDSEPNDDAIRIDLAFEPVWSEMHCPVLGRLQNRPDEPLEIRVESESGHWTGGWLPLSSESFELEVPLLENQTNRFRLSLRNAAGETVPCEPGSFSIRHGLSVASPPLPHSIGAEVWVIDEDRYVVDVLFPRSTPLPAEKTTYYKARRTLRPTDTGERLTIKLWEGEYDDPESNTWLGHLHIHAEDIVRPIPEGTEVEIHVCIDASRQMTVSAYVPLIDQRFEERVFVPFENEQSFIEKVQTMGQEFVDLFQLANEVEAKLKQTDDRAGANLVREFRRNLEDLDLARQDVQRNPDRAKQILASVKRIRGELLKLDYRLRTVNRGAIVARQFQQVFADSIRVVRAHGERSEIERMEELYRQGERYIEVEDWDEVEKISNAIDDIWWEVVSVQGWYWRNRFNVYLSNQFQYTDPGAAAELLEEGKRHVSNGSLMELRPIVGRLWQLLVKREGAERVRVKGGHSGLRK